MFRLEDRTVESDPYVLEEIRGRVSTTLDELKPGTSPAQWCEIARQQLLHWLKWARVYSDIAPHISAKPKNHRLPVDLVFGAFFVHEEESNPKYSEVPLLLALLQGDNATAKSAAADLDLPLTTALLSGPFPPCDAPDGGRRGLNVTL